MGIPHVTLDLRERFRAAVVDDSWTGTPTGRTPNPCVRCNGEVRFDAMLALADALGAARLATGHYARIARDDQGPLLRAGADPRKDQSYMLARLEPALLERLSFPLGALTKDSVRELARAAGLPVADRRESQDLCFAAGLGTEAFLRRHGAPGLRRPGPDRGRRRPRARAPRRPARLHRRPAPRPRRGERPSRSTCSRRTPDRHRHGRPARGARGHPREARARRCSTAASTAVEAARLRYGAAPRSRAARSSRPDGALELELSRPAEAVAPGQLACLLAGDRVTGYRDDRGRTRDSRPAS